MTNKLINFLAGIRILEEVESPINGKIIVQTDLAWGPHILVEGLSQSGGVVKRVWKPLFSKVKRDFPDIKSILILGLGGGTIAKFSKQFWPEAKIVGVEIDALMVEMGKKHLGLMNVNVETHIEDAYHYLTNVTNHFDLILVDIYAGRSIPEEFTTVKFANLVKQILTDNGVAVFNRLYGGEHTSKAEKFLKILKLEFPSVEDFYPEANVMYICRK